MVLTLLLSMGVAPAMAHTEDEPMVIPLLAGQDMEVGGVSVWNDGVSLCVKYELSAEALEAGWLLYETHLAVASDVADIPQTKPRRGEVNGNPIPGQFAYGADDLGGVSDWQVCIPLEELGAEGGDDLFIAAHAVIRDVAVGQATGIIYGTRTTGGTKGLYEIDVVNGTLALLKAITGGAADVNNGTGYSNGLAYDPVSNTLYFTAPRAVNVTPTPFWSYDIVGETLSKLADLPGSVVGASFFDGAYYYIPELEDTLWRIDDFDSVAPSEVFAEFGSANDCTFGDIAISDAGMLYGSTRIVPRKFFSLDLNSVDGDYQVFDGSNALDLQLAYGSNGMLYGVNHATGKFYSIDEATGMATVLPFVAAGFADLASGTLFVPQTESAWADGTRFVTKGNWATYLAYAVKSWNWVDTVVVPANESNGVNSVAILEVDAEYLFAASGQWRDSSMVGHWNDAEWVTFDSWDTWMQGTPNHGPNQKDLQVNLEFVDWGDYSPLHEYELSFTGEGSTVNFRIFDGYASADPPVIGPSSWYADNEGFLTVEIYVWS
jgi:hypothetical protein